MNTNSKVKILFLRELAKNLDKATPNWRSTHVILMDNAPYNTSGETLREIERLKMPTIFTAPYSYAASPVELFFAHMKNDILMGPGASSGKL